MNMRFEPSAGLSGELTAPADKSISHRAALLGAMASYPVRIENYLHAADTTSTLNAVRALGALVEVRAERGDRARRRPARGARARRADRRRQRRHPAAPAARLARGPGGTLLHARRRRLDPPPPGRQGGRAAHADGRASCRPARDASRRSPCAGGRLHSISYELPIASAQVKSCVLLAALAADGATTVGEPARSRDHTERLLLRAGVTIHRNGRHVTVVNADELVLERVVVPGDPSSAAFLIAAGVLVPGSRLLLRDVGVNWTRTGFLRILRRMQGHRAGRPRGRVGRALRARARQRPRRRRRRAGGHRGRARGGAAGDRRAAARRAARLLRRGRDGRARRAGAAPEGVRPHRHRRRGAARAGRRHRGDRGRLRRARHRWSARRHRSTRTATTAWR